MVTECVYTPSIRSIYRRTNPTLEVDDYSNEEEMDGEMLAEGEESRHMRNLRRELKSKFESFWFEHSEIVPTIYLI